MCSTASARSPLPADEVARGELCPLGMAPAKINLSGERRLREPVPGLLVLVCARVLAPVAC